MAHVVTSDALNALTRNDCEKLSVVRKRVGFDALPNCLASMADDLLVRQVTPEMARESDIVGAVDVDEIRFFIVGHLLYDVGVLNAVGSRGIRPLPVNVQDSSCSFGQGADGKWYGWSHRAIVGFTIGDMLFEEDCLNPESPKHIEGADDMPYVKLGHTKIETEEQARQAAMNFANYVS